MKSKVLSFCLLLLILISTSCKKESIPGITGQWTSVAFYIKDDGIFKWTSPTRFAQSMGLYSNSRFTTFTDVPGGSGTYMYDNSSKKLVLNYEADQYRNTVSSEILKVEKLTSHQLIISSFSPSGDLFMKTEYTRTD